MRRAALLIVLAAGLAGCATTRPSFRCEARGGEPWRAVYSTHLVVVTDLDSESARELARELDLVRAAVVSSLFQRRHDPPVRATVIAFRSTAEYDSFAPPGSAAYYARGAADPKIVIPGKLGIEQRRVLAHEMAHHVMSYVLLRQPRWFSEGLATWAETVGTTSGGIRMTTGSVPPGRRPQVRPQRISARPLLAWDRDVPVDGLGPYYEAAWLLVHYLVNQHQEALLDFEARLAGAEDPDEAFRAAFPEWDPAVAGGPERLDAALDGWARNGRFEGKPVLVDSRPQLSEQHMEPAEVHAIRILLWAGGTPGEGDEVILQAELDEGLAEDPSHPVLLRQLARRDGKDPLPLARLSVTGRPGDPRAWSFLAESLPPDAAAEREAALRRAAELAPRNPLALSALASLLLEEGRSGEALPLARQAVQLGPFSPEVLSTYAAVAADLGNCPQAVLASRRALDLLPDDGNPEQRARLKERLAAHLASCGAEGK
jgi:tetratricopeptide (TPR) repeat protein